MKRLALLVLVVPVALVLVPSTALAKGPIEASIEGPGLATPLRFGGSGEDGMTPHQPLMQLAEAAGFFPAAFERVPDPMLDRRPKGELGPRYVIDYRVPGPSGTEDRIVQDLYPYAKPRPVTYMAPGQTLFGTRSTRGGWYVAASPHAPPLMTILVDAGLPRNPPTGGGGSAFPWTVVGTLAALAALGALGGLAVMAVRRRPRPAT